MVVATMSRRPKTMPEPETLGILAFDAGKTMCRLISLYSSLSDEEITKLLDEVVKSKGVTYLNSNQENFLLTLAAAERLEELDNIAVTVSRIGEKCCDLGLARFDLVYADLKQGVIDLRKLPYNSRSSIKIIEKAEKLISATSSLYSAMEYMAELEAAEKKRQQQQRYWNTTTKPSLKPNMEYFNEKLVFQRKQVQNFKETSLWKQTFDKTVGIMARLVCIVYARICSVFGAYINEEQDENNNSMLFGFGFDHCCLLEHRELYHNSNHGVSEWYEEALQKRVVKSGPISKVATKPNVIRFLNNPMPMDFASGRDGTEKMMNGKHDKVLKLAPPSTVGGVGLALRYANLILLAERCLHAPATVGEDAREALYEMLPGRLRMKVKAKLRGRWAKEGDEGNDGHSLAEGWREAVEELMEWLSPVAHDTVRWHGERHLEKTRFETKPTAMLLQTLHYSDLEKAETAIVEVLVGLSCVYWCERRL
ncbi:hypothetical protein MtrunA17_Chr4g0009451 [Medicago truncatula]|uniref:Avr9/Cf-9 rapidly elicited protein n=2 Tax=Medicago truncatula TaxID=3880 RepID=G7JTD5_MEDTR|nr:Avr9/Cf-9 rapidly elicited protein [Medicago truncatula]RHN59084.1 hypothetical protein MtrunA17_Chr4g0009451 [Medicago truncatula]